MKLLLPALLLLTLAPASADDGAVEVAAGGLVPVRESRITMAKEVLRISPRTVEVAYEFRNDTAEPITTEVAFPVPSYSYDEAQRSTTRLGFEDFKLFIEGRPAPFKTRLEAKARGHDVTALLTKYGVDILSFNHAGDEKSSLTRKFSSSQRNQLVHSGAFATEEADMVPEWSVSKQYHWTQIFPAHGTVHIRHRYSPVAGLALVPNEELSPGHNRQSDEMASYRKVFTDFCVSPASLSRLTAGKGMISAAWVDFILTTANSWKRPIEDFTLLIERTNPKDLIDLCWDGPIEKVDANQFRMHKQNFVPARELHVGFYQQESRQNGGTAAR